jgi:hypothetical protein
MDQLSDDGEVASIRAVHGQIDGVLHSEAGAQGLGYGHSHWMVKPPEWLFPGVFVGFWEVSLCTGVRAPDGALSETPAIVAPMNSFSKVDNVATGGKCRLPKVR